MNTIVSSLLRKTTAAALGLTMIFGMSAATLPVLSEAVSITASAASSVSINATQVTLYGLNSWADEFITIPSSYATRFQLKVTGASNVSYSTNSSYLSVSSTGLVTATLWATGGRTAPQRLTPTRNPSALPNRWISVPTPCRSKQTDRPITCR